MNRLTKFFAQIVVLVFACSGNSQEFDDTYVDSIVREQIREEVRQQQLRLGKLAIYKLLATSSENQTILDALELEVFQEKRVTELQNELKTNIEKAKTKFKDNADKQQRALGTLRIKFSQEVSKLLLDEQIIKFSSLGLYANGLPKVLNTPTVASILGLSTQQLERIQNKSDKIANKIDNFVDSIRQEAHSSIISELTESQLSKLNELYSAREIIENASKSDLNRLYNYYLFTLPEDNMGLQNPSGVALRETKLKSRLEKFVKSPDQ